MHSREPSSQVPSIAAGDGGRQNNAAKNAYALARVDMAKDT